MTCTVDCSHARRFALAHKSHLISIHIIFKLKYLLVKR